MTECGGRTRGGRGLEESRRHLDSVREASDARRELVADIVHAQEEERRRLAVEIHDDAVQAMAAVLLRVGLLGTRLRDNDQLQLAREIEDSIRDMIARLRRLIVGLAPPELHRAGLVTAVRSALEQLKNEFGLESQLNDGLELEPSSETRTVAYRIVQEALANACKHAQASVLEVELVSQDGGVLGVIGDDGVGFNVEATLRRVRAGELGLVAMRERADFAGGWCRVESGATGTRVTFWIPERLGSGAPDSRATER